MWSVVLILYLRNEIAAEFDPNVPLFDKMMGLQGAAFRAQKGRVTQCVRIGDQEYFIKRHTGVGWLEIFKNLFQGRLPILGARNEWRALNALTSLRVATPQVVGYGERGFNPAYRESFVLLEALQETVSLETHCATWNEATPPFSWKLTLIKQIAHIAKNMHAAGINHRDFYLCHFLVKSAALYSTTPTIYLIDLHRAQLRQQVPVRWRVKDLAGLYFSSLDMRLTQHDYLRFIRYYTGQPLKKVFKGSRLFWTKVKQRGEKLYQKHHQRPAA